ncbi:MAG: AzlC family ABC transporter permease [Clostridia bacterium]|nr:AzlC family ABC transporter permease [Clostridia bacterium]
MTQVNSFSKGLNDGIPICLGYFSVAFAFGIFAVESGLTVWQSVIISLTNLTSAGQLAGVPIITCGGTLTELALSQLVINARYSLMSISLSQKFSPKVKSWDKLLIAYGNTDEVFAVAHSNDGEIGKKYMWGLILLPVIGWTGGTYAGAMAGNILPAEAISALGLAIYGMFIAIIVPVAKKEKKTALCVLLAIALSCIFRYLPALSIVPSGFTVIICAVTASVVFAILAPIDTAEKEGAASE